MADCIFCKIAAGEIPCVKLFESPEVLAFLDIGPLAPGHTLVIPRKHFHDITDVAPETLASLAACIPRLARAVIAATGASGLNLLQNTGATSGQAVFHLHFHLIPRVAGDQLGYRWNAKSYAPGEAATMQGRILESLQA